MSGKQYLHELLSSLNGFAGISEERISAIGEYVAQLENSAALSVPAAEVVGEPVAAYHVKVKGWGEELCFTEDGAQSLVKRLRRTKGQDGEATITPLYATTPKCSVCGDSGVEEVYGGHGTVMELPCSICTAAPSAPDGWQPIDSAPKHQNVLVWREDAGEPWVAQFTDATFYDAENGDPDDEAWFDLAGRYEGVEAPTHWRPLPAPPALGGSHE